MNGDTAELLTAITNNIGNGIRPLREDISKLREAVQDRGERLAHVEEKIDAIGDCGANATGVKEALRGVASNRYFLFSLLIGLLIVAIKIAYTG